MIDFNAKEAFSRNLGWLTQAEQEKLSRLHVGIIGMGGVGGQYAEILARLGVGRFTLCDPDQFSIENTNRQNECKTSNYQKNKAQVISDLVKDINPKAEVTVIPGELKLEQVDPFCESIDIYLDALDFFVIDLRVAIFRKMRNLGKTAITIAPIGAGATCLIFTKDSMSFDDYFGLHSSKDSLERAYLFLVGLSPTLQQRYYLQERERADMAQGKAPSLPIGVYACAAVAATTIVKLSLKRGKILAAPWSVHYDSYLMTLKKRYVWMGYRNPFQKIKMRLLRRMLRRS
jgi:molybdopterin/thiamine biosynthesis adenylyltransferase